MPKRRTRKNATKNPVGEEAAPAPTEKRQDEFDDREVERQITAIRALRDMEIEQLKTMLRLLRSNFSKEQLQVPVLQFINEHLPNLSVFKSGKDGLYEVRWKDKDGNLCTSQIDERNIHASLLHRLSMVYPNCSGAVPAFGFELSNKSVKNTLFGVDNLQIRGFALEEPSDTHILELQDTLRTPGVSNPRLSLGMTPKTRRPPKHGEMLLSVHGSPLGVFKEDNMEPIKESEHD